MCRCCIYVSFDGHSSCCLMCEWSDSQKDWQRVVSEVIYRFVKKRSRRNLQINSIASLSSFCITPSFLHFVSCSEDMCVVTHWNEPKEQILRSSKVIVEKSNFNGALNNLWVFVLVDLKHKIKISSNMGQKLFLQVIQTFSLTQSRHLLSYNEPIDAFKIYRHFKGFNIE